MGTSRAFGLFARINYVYDGDTMYGAIDQGLGVWNEGLAKNGMGLRLYGCNAREHNQLGGPEARDNLAALFPIGTIWPITCMAWDKYAGRIDVRIEVPGLGDLATHLISEGWAAPWNGVGPKPVPVWPRLTTGAE